MDEPVQLQLDRQRASTIDQMTCFCPLNIIEIEGLLFLGFGKCARSMENWFFPSSDVMRALKNGAL